MAFLGALIETVIKMVIVLAFAIAGIFLGKELRRRKNQKQA